MRVTPSRFLPAAAALMVAGCGNSASSSPAAAPASARAVAGASASVKIANFGYQPSPLTVGPGAVVSVTNTDGAEHTATSDVAGLFIGDDIKHGMTVTFTAPAKPGTYTFHCQYHRSMHGTLIVK